jgi:hypothetical protein
MSRNDLNFVVVNEHFCPVLAEIIFDGEPFEEVGERTMWDLVTLLGMFPSKSQARKNWNKTGQEIPQGFTHLENLGKLNHEIAIWNPVP